VIIFEVIYFCVASTVMGSLFLVWEKNLFEKKRRKEKFSIQRKKKRKKIERGQVATFRTFVGQLIWSCWSIPILLTFVIFFKDSCLVFVVLYV
jgi:hypothetical protein